MSDPAGIPEGYELVQRTQGSTFAGLVGPFYAKRQGKELSLGLRIEQRHLNSRGTCHGGLLATLADIALGYACVAASEDGPSKNFVTIDLSVEYMASTQAGDWLYSEVKVLNADSRTAAAAGYLMVEGGPVARISANFRMARSRAPQPAAPAEREMRDVILAHGLWVPGLVMQPLAARLAREGFRCHNFSYRGAGRPLAAHAERLARFAESVGPAHFVGHSLGGLVILEALQRDARTAAGRVVLLGAPVNGCYAGRRLARYPGGRWFLGASEELWREGRGARWSRPELLGVVAGTLPLGLGRLFGALPGVNDGVVRLEETDVEGMAERVALPVGHSAMLISARVAHNVAAFLDQGKFSAAPR